MTCAALYIDPRGPYPKLLGPELCWDEARDARTYAGPWPVVAHPPCGPWGRLRAFCTRQSRELGPIAVDQVRRFGGVLEHPEFSLLWRECRMPWPGEFKDEHGGFTFAVDQVGWGHKCRKRTWLYVVGTPRWFVEESGVRTMDPYAEPTHVINSTRRDALPEVSKEARRRTPDAFAEWLISLAEQARPQRSAAE